MNGFLNAEQRVRLACVLKHSNEKVGIDREMTLNEIGFVLGVTKERVRQIENSALAKMKKMGISSEILEVLQ